MANHFCFDRTDLVPDNPNSGANGIISSVGSFYQTDDAKTNNNLTTWEKYGTAGASWGTYFNDCNGYSISLSNLSSNFILSVSQIFAVIAIVFFQQTFGNEIIDYFLKTSSAGGILTLTDIIQRLHADIYLDFVSLAILVGAIVLFWRAVIQNKGASDVLGKVFIWWWSRLSLHCL